MNETVISLLDGVDDEALFRVIVNVYVFSFLPFSDLTLMSKTFSPTERSITALSSPLLSVTAFSRLLPEISAVAFLPAVLGVILTVAVLFETAYASLFSLLGERLMPSGDISIDDSDELSLSVGMFSKPSI